VSRDCILPEFWERGNIITFPISFTNPHIWLGNGVTSCVSLLTPFARMIGRSQPKLEWLTLLCNLCVMRTWETSGLLAGPVRLPLNQLRTRAFVVANSSNENLMGKSMVIEQLTPRQLKGNKNILDLKIRGGLCAVLAFWVAVATISFPAHAQEPGSSAPESAGPQVAVDSAQTLFPHFESGRIWLSGQANFIYQAHPSFYAQYSGANSLQSKAEDATSRVVTLYTGFEFTKSIEALVDIEEAGGGD